ncbi:putative transcription factor C2H2 family [Lupinus albus]|uniref:Putative transcription factor C2H2 family n=1 Tax=Lupinus albus TaxID=3870 RepID=A0A6A4PJR8_LUPAL|nr:putative transcription factor C2H2 family [Lupinus albus]
MEFKFRAVDNTSLPPSTPTSFPNTVSHSSLRGGFPGMIPSSRHSSFRMPMSNANEALWRELEKEQIRREIITGEIEQRRELEEEVRRELAAERGWGMTMAATSHGFSFDERVSAMRLTPSPYLFDNNAQPQPKPQLQPLPKPQTQFPQLVPPAEFKSFPETNNDKVIKLGLVKIPSPSLYRLNTNAWTQSQLPQLMAPAEEFKPSLETNNDKVVKQEAKPDPDHHDAKRKAVTPPDVDRSDHIPTGLRKKSKVEWICEVCQVSATSEKGLKDHLQGRKHKAKEIGLRKKKFVKSTNTSSRKNEKSVKPMETATSGLDAKAYRLPVQSSITWGDINQTMADKGSVKSNNEELSVQKIVKSSEPMDTTTSGLDAKADGPPLQSSITWGDINQKMACKGAAESINEEKLVQKNVKSNEPGDTVTSGLDAKADRLPFQSSFSTWGDINETMANKSIVKSNDEEQLEPIDPAALGFDVKTDTPSLQPSFIPCGDITKTMAKKIAVGYKYEEQSMKNENGKANVQGGMNAVKRKRMKFWCETCQVGALSQVVMESHKKGKKHLARINTSSVSVEAPELIKDTDAGNKEAMTKMAINFADSD